MNNSHNPFQHPEHPYTTDGCSGYLSAFYHKVLKRPPPAEKCCFKHDRPYWKGGTASERKQADTDLMRCVARDGYPVRAVARYLLVRVGGHPLLPFSWRWGYGHSYLHVVKNIKYYYSSGAE